MCTTGLFISEIFADFVLDLRMKGYSENTIKSTCYNAQKFLNEKGVSPRQTGADDIAEYISDLYELGRYSPHSIQIKIQSLKRFYGSLHRTGKILFDPTVELDAPKVKRSFPKDILSSQEMESIDLRCFHRHVDCR